MILLVQSFSLYFPIEKHVKKNDYFYLILNELFLTSYIVSKSNYWNKWTKKYILYQPFYKITNYLIVTGNVYWNVRNAFRAFASRYITWFEGGLIKTKASAFIYNLGKGQPFFLLSMYFIENQYFKNN